MRFILTSSCEARFLTLLNLGVQLDFMGQPITKSYYILVTYGQSIFMKSHFEPKGALINLMIEDQRFHHESTLLSRGWAWTGTDDRGRADRLSVSI